MRVPLLLALLTLTSARVSYDGYQVWRVESGPGQGKVLAHIAEERHLDVWGHGQDWTDVLVNPSQAADLKIQLAELGIHSTIAIPDVQSLVDRDYKSQAENPRKTFNFEKYNILEDIEAYLQKIAAEDSRVTISSLGKSYEDRDLWQVKISVGEGKKAVWFDCGIHAREWITPATCMWGINLMLTSYGSNAAVTKLLDAYDIYMTPVINPDGYAYTQSDRMWRKNRNKYDDNVCTGTDLNRNFDDHWGGMGSSSESCSQSYRGPTPSSEPETQHTQAGIVALAPAALFSLHSYGQLWMYPPGWTYEDVPEAAELDQVSKIGVEVLTAVHGTPFNYGPLITTIYPAAGTTIDYGYGVGVVHSYTLELRDTGRYGFLLPESQIRPTGEETWAGLIAGILAIP